MPHRKPYVAAIQINVKWDPVISTKRCGSWLTKALDRVVELGGDLRTTRITGTASGCQITARLKYESAQALLKAADGSTQILMIDHPAA